MFHIVVEQAVTIIDIFARPEKSKMNTSEGGMRIVGTARKKAVPHLLSRATQNDKLHFEILSSFPFC